MGKAFGPTGGGWHPRWPLIIAAAAALGCLSIAASDPPQLVPGESLCFEMFKVDKDRSSEALQEIVAACTLAISAKPTSDPLYMARGEAQMRLNRPSDAIADLSKSLTLMDWMSGPLFADLKRALTTRALVNRGRSYASLEQFRAAIRDFTSALELAPDEEAWVLISLYWRGYSYEGLGETSLADADYQHYRTIRDDAFIRERLRALEQGR
jgi:tetratricopeptide (TPR) repeat protein